MTQYFGYSPFEASKALLGKQVKLSLGVIGELKEIREDGSLVLDFPWGRGFLASSMLDPPSRYGPGSRVSTPYGRGRVKDIFSRDFVGVMYALDILDIILANGSHATCVVPAFCVGPQPEEIYPPTSRVLTPFGIGRVSRSEERKDVGRVYEVRLSVATAYLVAREVIILESQRELLRLSPLLKIPWYHEPIRFVVPCDVILTPFAARASLLSAVSSSILSMFSTKEALTLRQVCGEFRASVAGYPWDDKKTRVEGSVQGWRACFPVARAANLSRRHRKRALTDADCRHLRGVEDLNLDYSPKLTSSAFENFLGLKRLSMRWCNQPTITDAAFQYLRGIHTLDMSGCDQPTITDAAFVHLQGIHTLLMSKCNQGNISGMGFKHLVGLHTLDMSDCQQIPDSAFLHLRGIHTLNVSDCRSQLSNAAFLHLRGINTLHMSGCEQLAITDSAFENIKGIEELDISRCRQLSDLIFQHLEGVKRLNLSSCTQFGRCAGLKHLRGIQKLHMAFCKGPAIYFARELGLLDGNHSKNYGLDNPT